MKKLRIDFLFAAALLLGGGLAVADNYNAATNTVFYNDASENQPENWKPVPPGRTVHCETNTDNACSQTRDENGAVISSQPGDASLI